VTGRFWLQTKARKVEVAVRRLSPICIHVLAVTLLALAGCGGGADPGASSCQPQCDDRVCGDDGCGGVCGTCAQDESCDAGACLPATPDECEASCDDLEYACGEHCGVACGTCADDERCVDHACVCAPSCTVATCGQDDGCGGTCAECPRDVSCADCPLTLSAVDREVVDDAVRTVTVALDFAPSAQSPLPGMADLRLLVDGDATLTQVATGQALIASDKTLAADPQTGKPYRVMSDGTLQLLVLSTTNDEPIPAGRWLFLTFRLGDAYGPADPPVAFRLGLVEREAIFAPPPADAALWGSHFGTPLVVWSDDVEVNHAP